MEEKDVNEILMFHEMLDEVESYHDELVSLWDEFEEKGRWILKEKRGVDLLSD